MVEPKMILKPKTKVQCEIDNCRTQATMYALSARTDTWQLLCPKHYQRDAYGFGDGFGHRISSLGL